MEEPPPVAAPTALPESALSGEERKVVSVLFADLVDFVGLGERLDPEDLRSLLTPYYARLRAELEGHGGTVEKFIGDAVMAVFGAPVAHEDDAERAVRAGLRILESIEELNATRPESQLAVRTAVSTGEALVALGSRPAEGESIVTGDVVNTASRLQQVGPPGALVVDALTYRATRGVIEYEALEPVAVKGKADSIPIWRAKAARSRFGLERGPVTAPPFVGREHELALLREASARALRGSTVQLVTLTGEPGVGKSRLVAEFEALVTAESGPVTWRQGRCLPYGEGITFWALGQIVKSQAGILESDGPDKASEKLTAALREVVEETSERAWFHVRLAPLVGAETAEAARHVERSESFAAWRRFLEAIASKDPLVLVLEDLHWADDALLDFIEHLVDWSTSVPLLIVCTARPELYERRPDWGGGKRNSTTASLSELTFEETARLVGTLLSGAILPPETQAVLLERAGGNPLYAEEFVRMLRDRGILQHGGPVTGIAAGAEISVPETIQTLIAARLDTLSPERKSLLQAAAVVGKVFWASAVASVSGQSEEAVEAALQELARQELVRRVRSSSVYGENEYSFWHVLVRDVAYRQIPRAARAAKHQAAAEWFERISHEHVTDHAELLAHHYGQALALARAAGQETSHLAERARVALVNAGDHASALSAFDAAARFYSSALELWPDDDPERARLLFRLGRTIWFAFGGGLEQIVEARERFELAGDLEAAAEAETFLGFDLWFRGERDSAYERVGHAIRLLEHEPASPAKAYALVVQSRIAAFGGEPRATELGRQALALAEELGLDELRAVGLATLGLARINGGDTGGLADLEQSLALAIEINAPLEISRGYNNIATAYWLQGRLALASEMVATARGFCERFGLPGQLRFVAANESMINYLRGHWVEAEAAAEEFIADTEAGTSHFREPLCRWVRAKIRLARGDSASALADTAKELELVRRSPDPQNLGLALTLRARVLLGRGQPLPAAELTDEFLSVPGLPLVTGVAVVELAWALVESGRGSELLSLEAAKEQNGWIRPALAVASGDFGHAADLLADMGAASDEAFARLRAAEMLAAAGSWPEAEAQLVRALAFHRSVGATEYVRAGEALLATLER